MRVDREGEIQGIGFGDGSGRKIIYPVVVNQDLSGMNWFNVRYATHPEKGVWRYYEVSAGKDWYNLYGYYPVIDKIHYINDNDACNGIVLFDAISIESEGGVVYFDDVSVVKKNYDEVEGGERVYYYHNDHLGTPQVMTDITGNIVWKADYEPFGKVNIVVENIENNFRFPGQYYISETGLYYNWWRWYKSETGRYMEKDLALFLFPNYLYANNNPLFYKDLKGLYNTECEERCGVIVYIVCRISFVSLCILACAATESPPLCDTICKRVVGPEICIPIKISICKLYCPPQKPEDDKRPKPDKKPSCIK